MSGDLPDFVVKAFLRYNFLPSDVLRRSDDAEEPVASSSYAKEKEIEFDPDGVVNRAKLRIKFDLKAGAGGSATGRIYKNGVPLGTERFTTETEYQTYTEDLGPWAPGDMIQLWAKWTAAVGAFVRNFRVYCDIEEMSYVGTW